uniref:Gypsy retrotransposon integrase-like protein 1 n=1 Tax=Amphiprion ocellaris TaxID=80972 RepID=A0A3Q1C3U8_AMPOC
MNSVLAGLIYKTCAVYLDDIVVASPTFEQHLVDLEEVLERLQTAGLSLKLKKCQFCLKDFTFLGYRITSSGISPDPDKVKAVKEFNVPTSVKNVRQFLGLTGYYRRFIQDYARHAEPLHALTRKDASFCHLGVSKTLARLRFRFFWPKMAADVKRYVTSCSVCQFTKPCQRKPAGLMVPVVPQKPWEYVGVDFVGPLPRTPAGNAYLIVFVDYMTKWIEASAVREAMAQVAAGKFVTDIFARHGAPTYIISDRGSPFVSELFEHVVSTLGSVHRLTTAYHPQTDATERVNRTLKTAIRAYVGDRHTSWDKYLPHICFALRTAPHDSTGLSPSMMLYDRELDTPLDLITQPSSDGVDEPGVSYPETLRASLQEAHDHARAALDYSHDRQKHYYDLRRRHTTFDVGDLVRVKTHPRSDAQSNFTETHLNDKEHLKLQQGTFGQVYFSSFTTRSRGVALLIKKICHSKYSTLLKIKGAIML